MYTLEKRPRSSEPKDFKKFKHRDKINKILVRNNEVWSCSVDKTICQWDIETQDCLKVFSGHRKAVTCFTFVDNMMFSGSFDRTARAWDIDSGLCIGVYNRNDNWVSSIAASEQYVICGGYDCVVNVYDLKSCKKIQVFEGHVKRIESIVIDESGRVFTSSADQTIRVWDVDTGECMHVFHSRDHCFDVVICDNHLYCRNYEQVQCWDLDTYKQLPPFLNTKAFDIKQDEESEQCLMVGFSPEERAFTIYNINHENGERKIMSTIEATIFNATSVSINHDYFYYAAGRHIQSVFIDTPTQENQLSTQETTPTYVLHQQLFNYFVDVLLIPSNIIADNIDLLQKSNTLTQELSLDDQINILQNQLNKNNSICVTPLGEDRRVDFNIHLDPITPNQGSSTTTTNIYTRDEMSLDFETRTELFYERLRSHLEPQHVRQPTVILVRREELVFDALKHFSVLRDESDLHKPMYIFFQGERGLDMGGVTREFYQLLSEQILDSNNALFVRTGTQYTYHPNPASQVNESHLQYFLFIGKLVGKAIFDLQMMDTHFSRVIFKLIVGKSITYRDLEHVDPALFLSMERILSSRNVEQMGLSFAADLNDFGSNNEIELIPDGTNVMVNDDNKVEFVQRYSQWKLVESVKKQLERLLQGVFQVIPRPYFCIFDEQELELLLCGSPEINVEEWKSCTEYEGGFDASMKCIENFWCMVSNMDQVHRSKLLQFVTGTTCVPLEGFEGLHPHFTICRVRSPPEFLPIAHTCLNRLDIPDYPDFQTLEQRFLQAIDHGLLGFDRI
ncbi:E3 ubiquitin-protein ligase [Acrasis kona]|uniref:HECT-type E3 ubiquitin transferase n=1 Tax=Acrasis kona TaxID=1008807 RepID=A0AAW2ZK74_9EUKA